MDRIIEMHNVSRVFKVRGRPPIQALSDISLNVGKGEVIGYIGRNGAGKSTTIKTICGIITPTEGTVRIAGLDPHRQRRKLASRIGVMFGQRSHLLWDLSLKDSFELLGTMYSVPGAILQKRVKWLTEMLEIDSLINQPVRTLSLGQRTRGELVATLLHNPELVLLDEPTIGLDIYIRDKLLEAIKEFKNKEGTSFLITSHNLDDIERVCNRVMIIDSGKLLHEGSLEEMLRRQKILVTVDFSLPIKAGELITDRCISVLEDKPGQIVVELEPNVQVGRLLDCLSGCKVADIKIQERRLEAVLKQIYSNDNVK